MVKGVDIAIVINTIFKIAVESNGLMEFILQLSVN